MDPAAQEVIVWIVLGAAFVGLLFRFKRRPTACSKCSSSRSGDQAAPKRHHLPVLQDRS